MTKEELEQRVKELEAENKELKKQIERFEDEGGKTKNEYWLKRMGKNC